jgi:hypothetical protein
MRLVIRIQKVGKFSPDTKFSLDMGVRVRLSLGGLAAPLRTSARNLGPRLIARRNEIGFDLNLKGSRWLGIALVRFANAGRQICCGSDLRDQRARK